MCFMHRTVMDWIFMEYVGVLPFGDLRAHKHSRTHALKQARTCTRARTHTHTQHARTHTCMCVNVLLYVRAVCELGQGVIRTKEFGIWIDKPLPWRAGGVLSVSDSVGISYLSSSIGLTLAVACGKVFTSTVTDKSCEMKLRICLTLYKECGVKRGSNRDSKQVEQAF